MMQKTLFECVNRVGYFRLSEYFIDIIEKIKKKLLLLTINKKNMYKTTKLC